VLQNDEFMREQKVWWSSNVLNYKDKAALKDKETGVVSFKQGEKALAFLSDAENAPWIQKDPRMCITLGTWLELLNNEPAVLFTYRHPIEVANSLVKREKNFSLEHGLRLWIIYNMKALQNSAGLCRVYTSNEAILGDTMGELFRITDTMHSKCGVPAAPKKITRKDIEVFIDPDLQHTNQNEKDEGKPIIETRHKCPIHEYDSSLAKGTPAYERERSLYLKAMRIYCDLKSGDAYHKDYEWPTLQ